MEDNNRDKNKSGSNANKSKNEKERIAFVKMKSVKSVKENETKVEFVHPTAARSLFDKQVVDEFEGEFAADEKPQFDEFPGSAVDDTLEIHGTHATDGKITELADSDEEEKDYENEETQESLSLSEEDEEEEEEESHAKPFIVYPVIRNGREISGAVDGNNKTDTEKKILFENNGDNEIADADSVDNEDGRDYYIPEDDSGKDGEVLAEREEFRPASEEKSENLSADGGFSERESFASEKDGEIFADSRAVENCSDGNVDSAAEIKSEESENISNSEDIEANEGSKPLKLEIERNSVDESDKAERDISDERDFALPQNREENYDSVNGQGEADKSYGSEKEDVDEFIDIIKDKDNFVGLTVGDESEYETNPLNEKNNDMPNEYASREFDDGTIQNKNKTKEIEKEKMSTNNERKIKVEPESVTSGDKILIVKRSIKEKTDMSENAIKEKAKAVKEYKSKQENKTVSSSIKEKPERKLKVLFVSPEVSPFIHTGGLGEVSYALPVALAEKNVDIRVMLPLYSAIPEEYRKKMKYIGNTYVNLAWRYQYAGVFELKQNGVVYYFIDNEFYFKRDGIYGHFDDGERFAFFSKAVLELLRVIDFYPDVIHSNDWQSALVPVFLDAFYRGIEEYKNIRTLFTIHNIQYQGKYDKEIVKDILGLGSRANWVMMDNCCNYMKGAIECAKAVSTVSKAYVGEIMDPYFSYGLDSILRDRSYKLSGILNGIDNNIFNPETDKKIIKNYNYETIEYKKENKKALLEKIGLQYDENRPLISMVSRLTEQKGIDLLLATADKILSADLQLVILGKGDWKYEKAISDIQYRYSNKVRAIIDFSDEMARQIYAGSDIFLMPSKYEPCGLSQMISMRYGTVPIVRETGGLKDSVVPFNINDKTGTGFTFYSYNSYDMLDAIWRAFATYFDKESWSALIKNIMSADFGWDKQSEEYLNLYKSL